MDTRTTLNGRIHTDKDKKREKWVHAFNRKICADNQRYMVKDKFHVYLIKN